MTAIESINHFVDVMLAGRTKFENIKAEIDRQNKSVSECISRFQSGINAITSKDISIQDSELQEILKRQLSELKILLEKVAASLSSMQKGMTFINKHEDSFNIAVFGKVKAGKSYTGNFIMGNVIRDMGIQTSYDKLERPTVHVIDRGKESTRNELAEFDEEGKEGFRVDPNEATSTIQLFRLGGMVWIDTPGIGSVTEANEILAKDFIDNADLIVYMSNGDAAGTQQDFAEVKALHEKSKRFLFLITQSDTTDVDLDDNGKVIHVLVPKNDKDRIDMEDHVCEGLRKDGITDLQRDRELLTISTKLALEALKTNNEAMFDASNLKRFLDVLVSITENDAAKLKLSTPALRINSMITDIVKGLKNADAKLYEHMKSLNDARRRLTERNDYLMSKMLNECMTGITEIISRKAKEIESGGSGMSSSELQEIVGSEIYRVIMKTCAEEFSGSEAILSSYSDSLKVSGIKDLSMRRETRKYTYQEVYETTRYEARTFGEGLRKFGRSLIGLDTVFHDVKTRNRNEYVNIDLGVNLQEVMHDIRNGIDSMFMDKVPSVMKEIADNFVAPVAQVRENAGRNINAAIRELEGLKIKI